MGGNREHTRKKEFAKHKADGGQRGQAQRAGSYDQSAARGGRDPHATALQRPVQMTTHAYGLTRRHSRAGATTRRPRKQVNDPRGTHPKHTPTQTTTHTSSQPRANAPIVPRPAATRTGVHAPSGRRALYSLLSAAADSTDSASLRSACSSCDVASMYLRLASSTVRPSTIDHSPPVHVTG